MSVSEPSTFNDLWEEPEQLGRGEALFLFLVCLFFFGILLLKEGVTWLFSRISRSLSR